MSAPQRSAGFSLIEILIVMALIGIIAVAVFRNVGGGFGKGQQRAATALVNTIAMSVEQFYVDNGSYPDRLEDLVSKPSSAPNWSGPYAKSSQLVDPWGSPLGFRAPGEEGRDFDIVSLGKDKAQGGEGNAKDIGSWE